jgi:deoxyribodipyrimidine photo-lyase
VRELAWREFYVGVLYHFPHLPTAPFHPEYAAVRWRDAPDELAAWQEGRTGYPPVDAAMRQLRAEGWLANRARLVAASFLVKDLLLDWRQGERWFRHHLLDGDPAANVGNWQWVAGVGTDAAPYFRVFNPVLQGRKFDPDGTYVRRWVPELARVPPAYLHAPWEMPRELQAQVGCRIGRDYPAPLVDHEVARRRALAAFERARAAAEPRG